MQPRQTGGFGERSQPGGEKISGSPAGARGLRPCRAGRQAVQRKGGERQRRNQGDEARPGARDFAMPEDAPSPERQHGREQIGAGADGLNQEVGRVGADASERVGRIAQGGMIQGGIGRIVSEDRDHGGGGDGEQADPGRLAEAAREKDGDTPRNRSVVAEVMGLRCHDRSSLSRPVRPSVSDIRESASRVVSSSCTSATRI